LLTATMPLFVLANPGLGYWQSLANQITTILNNLVILLITLAVVWFIWNVVRYTMSDDEEKKSAAKSQMIWGIIAIAVIVSIWGLVGLLQGWFGVSGNGAAQVPNLPTSFGTNN